MLYSDFIGDLQSERQQVERTQEALMNLINNGFVLANFTGWDRDTQSDPQAYLMMTQNLSQYFYITKNSYSTVFENLEYIAGNIKK